MGYDYALVHLKYTIPPTLLLAGLYYPLLTRLAIYKILFLVTVAVTATTPWDAYLIKSRIWTYPPNAVIGPTLFDIPIEEVFFFVIQTLLTSLLYLLTSTPVFHPAYLKGDKQLRSAPGVTVIRWSGTAILTVLIVGGILLVTRAGEGLYLGLILVWAGPFALLLWSLAYQFIIGLPISTTLIPIILPTLYLWIIDTLELKRGTWAITSGTKLGLHLWDGLEIEEAFFFLVTNIMVVWGLVAFDNAHAILQTFPNLFPDHPSVPSPTLLVRALLTSSRNYDGERIEGLQQALSRLRAKSRSFYLASSVFRGRLRIDLVILYSFCRVADDLIDEANSNQEARNHISKLRSFLDIAYAKTHKPQTLTMSMFVRNEFPERAQSALLLLPTYCLSSQPLYDLLAGFEMDLTFSKGGEKELSGSSRFPIVDEAALRLYGARVAGTVAEMCIELVYHHTSTPTSIAEQKQIVEAGGQMGIALQYVNIARDIAVDSANGRVYIPTTWLKEEGLTPTDVLENPSSPQVERLRQKLLDSAMAIYERARGAIELLPAEARAPMRVAVESYVEIGRVLRAPGYRIKAGRATVPKLRRLKVAVIALTRSE